jgi:hypothetical protein
VVFVVGLLAPLAVAVSNERRTLPSSGQLDAQQLQRFDLFMSQ